MTRDGTTSPGVRTVAGPVEEVVADLRRRGVAPHVLGPVAGKRELIGALGAALAFPEWVGANWDALYDALRDLSWLPPGPQVVVWVDPAALERASPTDHEPALRVLRDAAEAAAHGIRPLTVLLVGGPATS